MEKIDKEGYSALSQLPTLTRASIELEARLLQQQYEEAKIAGNEATFWEALATRNLEAIFDPLTGLSNRWAYYEKAPELAIEAAKSEAEITTIFIDINRFHNYNNTHGHRPKGDQLLKQLSQSITESGSRKTDLNVRWGGEEFLMFLPFSGIKRGLMVSRNLTRKFASYQTKPSYYDNPGLIINNPDIQDEDIPAYFLQTVSIGIFTTRIDLDNLADSNEYVTEVLDESIHKSNQAMLEAKRISRSLEFHLIRGELHPNDYRSIICYWDEETNSLKIVNNPIKNPFNNYSIHPTGPIDIRRYMGTYLKT